MNLSFYFSSPFLLSMLTMANVAAAAGGLLYIASISMKTVIPLRIAAIGSAFFFLSSGILARSFPPIFLYGILLPLNTYRLYQMIELIKKVRTATSGDLSMNWLQPFMTRRRYRKGDVLFRFYWKTVYPHIGTAIRYLNFTSRGRQWIANLHSNVFRAERELSLHEVSFSTIGR